MRLPWILWRTMFLELARLVLITAGVLVSVVAFAGAIKPLGDGKLEPGDVMWFMVLSIPPMLAYVLPLEGRLDPTRETGGLPWRAGSGSPPSNPSKREGRGMDWVSVTSPALAPKDRARSARKARRSG